jgi:hypothetical protein
MDLLVVISACIGLIGWDLYLLERRSSQKVRREANEKIEMANSVISAMADTHQERTVLIQNLILAASGRLLESDATECSCAVCATQRTSRMAN